MTQNGKIVFFDVDGVLVHGWHARPELRRRWDENITHDLGIDRERLSSEFFGDPRFTEVITGKMDLTLLLKEVLPGLGYSGEAHEFVDYWLYKDSMVNFKLIDKVKILKASGKVRLFIATNQVHERARYLMEDLGFAEYFEDIFHSARAGAMKPGKAYFDYVSKTLRLERGNPPVLFDDTPEVIEGARLYGWEAHEYQDTGSLIADRVIGDILISYAKDGNCRA